MAFQTVPNGIEIVMNATQNGVPIVNVFWSKTSGVVTTGALGDAADAVKGWWDTYIKPGMHPSYVLDTIVATDKSVANGSQVTRTYTTGNAGTASGAAAAANAATVISWRTAHIGRSFRGRTYIGALTTGSFSDAQNVTSGFAGGMATAGAALITALGAVSQTLCVLSRYANLVLRVTGLLTEIIGVVVDTKVDSQRRRTAN